MICLKPSTSSTFRLKKADLLILGSGFSVIRGAEPFERCCVELLAPGGKEVAEALGVIAKVACWKSENADENWRTWDGIPKFAWKLSQLWRCLIYIYIFIIYIYVYVCICVCVLSYFVSLGDVRKVCFCALSWLVVDSRHTRRFEMREK